MLWRGLGKARGYPVPFAFLGERVSARPHPLCLMQGDFNEWMQLALLVVLTAAIVFYVTR